MQSVKHGMLNSTQNNPKKGKRGPSIREIAAALDLSKSTVSLALGTSEEACPLASHTRQEIIDKAAEMGYRSNSIARTMRTGRFNSVSIILGRSHPRYLPTEMLYGAQGALEVKDYRLNLTWIDEDKFASPDYAPKELTEWCCDGLIIQHTGDLPEHASKLLHRHKIPCVWANSRLKKDSVYPDDFAGSYQATQKLIELGHKEIGYVSFSRSEHYSHTDRKGGYTQAMEAAGLVPRVFQEKTDVPLSEMRHDIRGNLADKILSSTPRPSALLCYEIEVSAPILVAALRAGLKVPRDLSIITFGRYNRNDTGISISTMQLNFEQVGAEAARMVLRKIDKPEVAIKSKAIPLSLDNEDSVAPPLKRLKRYSR